MEQGLRAGCRPTSVDMPFPWGLRSVAAGLIEPSWSSLRHAGRRLPHCQQWEHAITQTPLAGRCVAPSRSARCETTSAEAASQDAEPTHAHRIHVHGALPSHRSQDTSHFARSAVCMPGVPSTAPFAPPMSDAQLQALVDFITSCQHVTVLTGAGVSTESRIPDYRGPAGAYTSGYKPMSHQQFMSAPSNRRRYWARNFAGWNEFSSKQPNSAHEGLARLQSRGWVADIVTQNVDRLHQRAGASKVLELHGTTHRVICTSCGVVISRFDLQEEFSRLNPRAQDIVKNGTPEQRAQLRRKLRETYEPEPDEEFLQVRPDGDVEVIGSGEGFVVPSCKGCGGVLKPDVVFFGDNVPKQRAQRALSLVESGDGLLVVGSSVMVYSAFRLVKAAKAQGATIGIVNVGLTRADDIADVKVERIAGEVLARLAAHPALLTSRPVAW